MSNPIFRIKCKIDGEEHTVDVQTHGNRSIHPGIPIIRTKEQAIAHLKSYAETHCFEEEDGAKRFVAHIDGAGEEHTITDIGECTIVERGQEKRIQQPGAPTPADVQSLVGATAVTPAGFKPVSSPTI